MKGPKFVPNTGRQILPLPNGQGTASRAHILGAYVLAPCCSICPLSNRSSAGKKQNFSKIIFFQFFFIFELQVFQPIVLRTATQYDQLLASFCCPSVCLSETLCIVALRVGVVYTAKSCTINKHTGYWDRVPSRHVHSDTETLCCRLYRLATKCTTKTSRRRHVCISLSIITIEPRDHRRLAVGSWRSVSAACLTAKVSEKVNTGSVIHYIDLIMQYAFINIIPFTIQPRPK